MDLPELQISEVGGVIKGFFSSKRFTNFVLYYILRKSLKNVEYPFESFVTVAQQK